MRNVQVQKGKENDTKTATYEHTLKQQLSLKYCQLV